MSKKKKRKAAKKAKGRNVHNDDQEILLGPVVGFLHENLTEELCAEVFGAVRVNERERQWSLYALSRFWLSVVVDPPPSLRYLIEKCGTTERSPLSLLPVIESTHSAFSQRCKNLSSAFFTTLYTHFVERVRPQVPLAYASQFSKLRRVFTDVLIIDGSRLDRVAKRLKILWDEESVVLPGCLTAVYDMFRGIAVDLSFSPNAAEAEHDRGMRAIEVLRAGSLLLGDRLYCNLEMFEALDDGDCFGLFRRKKTIKIEEIKQLSAKGDIEDWLVWAGTGKRRRKLRLIRITRDGKVYEALTNELRTTRLSAKTITELYPLRWQVERLFYDLKEVLNLKRFYAANPNGVAMQVYAGAIVHVAFRIAQAQIAEQASIKPEELSPKKLFPRLSLASITLIALEFGFDLTQQENPDAKLKRPDWSAHPNLRVLLSNILIETRKDERKRPGYTKGRARWKSFAHVDETFRLT